MEVTVTGDVTRLFRVDEASQVGQARRESTALAQALGFDEAACGRVALVATELATNMLKHGRGGCFQLSGVAAREGMGVEICAIDEGPGFTLEDGLRDGYSTAGTPGTWLGAISLAEAGPAILLAPIAGMATGTRLRGHEFHYSTVTRQTDAPLARVTDADGALVAETGSRRGMVTGSYFHMIAREQSGTAA